MFRKNSKPTRPSSASASGKALVPTIISRDLHMLGNIVHEDGTIDMDGTLDGNLRCRCLTVRPNGVIQGEVQADQVHVYGRVNGLIRAKQVSLFAGCHIEGIVMHEQLSIEDGAFIDGKLKRLDKSAAPASLMLELPEAEEEKPVKMLENIRLIR
ncbi:MAG: polymer-forming cytoskeletal protein [Alphaproteobacteria bacterium]|nr:polymer-forming cytoskeletal protein [Alphaproteobacteria bacterium]